MEKKQIFKLYTVFMAILAVISIVLVIMDYESLISIEDSPYIYIDNSILVLFAIDYFVQLVKSEKKWQFIKTHIFDLLAIIPFSAIFSVFRLTRLLRLARLSRLTKTLRFVKLVGLTGKLQESAKRFLKTNGLIYLLIICTIILIVSSVLFYILWLRTSPSPMHFGGQLQLLQPLAMVIFLLTLPLVDLLLSC